MILGDDGSIYIELTRLLTLEADARATKYGVKSTPQEQGPRSGPCLSFSDDFGPLGSCFKNNSNFNDFYPAVIVPHMKIFRLPQKNFDPPFLGDSEGLFFDTFFSKRKLKNFSKTFRKFRKPAFEISFYCGFWSLSKRTNFRKRRLWCLFESFSAQKVINPTPSPQKLIWPILPQKKTERS